MKTPAHTLSRNGSVMLIALLTALVLTTIAASSIAVLQDRNRTAYQAASWQEALLAAEAGVDLAISELRKSLTDPASAWEGWRSSYNANGTIVGGNASLESGVYYTSTVLLRTGEGGRRSWAEVQVDAPPQLVDPNAEQWYRVRAMGVCEIPGGAVAAGDSEDRSLRRVSLRFNRHTGRAVDPPQATRLIEAVIRPTGAFRNALLGIINVNMNNHNIIVDSYDSRDPMKSTNGRYDVNKRQENGDIATNGLLIDAGDAHIYGDASTNGGTVLDSENVSGEIRNDFYQEIFPVQAPNVSPDPGTPSSVTGDATFVAQAGAPSQYRLSQIKLSGGNKLRIQGNPNGTETFCQIIVTGDISLSGNAEIILDPGVYVRIFVAGDADISGNGVMNPNSALHFQLYGLDRNIDSDGDVTSPGDIKIAGNGAFSGSVYAPHYDITMVGGGNSNEDIFGSFVGRTISMTGIQAVHYDEALADGGLIADYKVASWFEDSTGTTTFIE